MGDAFANEAARRNTFDVMMGGFLQSVDSRTHIVGNKSKGNTDRLFRINGRCMIIWEDKVEMGHTGDPYMQVARSYDLACEKMNENGVTPDAPVFLLCVVGECFCSLFAPYTDICLKVRV